MAVSRAQEALSHTVSANSNGSKIVTQYKTADGAPLSDFFVADQIQASLAANPNASKGGYEGPPMNLPTDAAGWAAVIAAAAAAAPPVVVSIDGQAVFTAVQRQAARAMDRGGAGVPG